MPQKALFKGFVIWLASINFFLAPESSFAAEPAGSQYNIGGASGADAASFGKWYSAFRKALQKNDKNEVARFIQYPLHVYWGGGYDSYTGENAPLKAETFRSKSFLANYDRVFSKRLRNRLIDAWKDEFWDRDQGVCLASGVVWFEPDGKGHYKVKTINYECVPPDIQSIQAQIKAAKNKGNKAELANLYSSLAGAYDDGWRTYQSERSKDLRPVFVQKSEDAYRQAIALRTGVNAKSPEQAHDLRMLADNLKDQPGKAASAEEFYTKALVMQRSVLAPQSKALNSTFQALQSYYADMPAKLKELLKSDLPRQQSAVTQKEKLLGAKPDNQKLKAIVSDYIQLGETCKDLNLQTEEKRAFIKAYDFWKRIKPADENLASDLLEPLVEIDMVENAKDVYEQIKDFGTMREARKKLILALARRGKYAEADPLLESAVQEAKESEYGCRALAELVEVYIIEKKLDAALDLADSAVKKCAGESGYHAALQAKGRVEALLGDNEAAENAYRTAIDDMTQRYPNDLPDLSLRRELAEVYIKEMKFAEAEKVADEIVSALSKTGMKTAALGDAVAIKAQSLASSSPAEADKCFQEAIAIKSNAQGADDQSVAELMQAYAAFLDKNHKDAEAQSIRSRIKVKS